jgi:hypothetical protein
MDGRAKPGHDGGGQSMRELKRLLFRGSLVRAGARGLPDYLTQSSPRARRALRRCFKALRAKRHVVLLWIATWQITAARGHFPMH